MDDCPSLLLKKICCTCLSQDRQLKQLCRLNEGINNLYLLLSYDSEAFREGFYNDTSNWFICWECWAVVMKISRFRSQACAAQKQLSHIIDGRTNIKLLDICMSRLTLTYKSSYDKTIKTDSDLTDNFIDCGPDIKTESDEDIPLSELHNNSFVDDRQYSDENIGNQEKTNVQPVYKKRKKKSDSYEKKKNLRKCSSKLDSSKEYFTTSKMSEDEMCDSRNKRKMAALFADAPFKCKSCIEVYKNQIDFNKHVSNFHTQKCNYSQCDICQSYVESIALPIHRTTHYTKYSCTLCDSISYDATDIVKHLQSKHSIEPGGQNTGEKKTRRVLNPGSKPRRNAAMMDKRTPYGFQCAECDKYFDNKSQRWKHVQQKHREGYKCAVCDKRFAFKNNLSRHERMHTSPPPRVQCLHCDKRVRVDLAAAHARTHAPRARPVCVACGKRFASRASYEHHLKHSQAHAAPMPPRYKCSHCDKGYRSRGELTDHVNYNHMGKTKHKCPICEKALATRRCVGRHVRRAHGGVSEARRDKICQRCGKAFRDKKGLREHEFIHTGERPLSCEICGCTFRQSASLYTHRKRVHKIFPQKKNVQLLEPEEDTKRAVEAN